MLFSAASNLTSQFTGKERDAETGLDYFLARYYSGAQGRFLSPDAVLADQHKEDPQSWNMYSYVRNNPVTNTDPDGRDCTNGLKECAEFLVGVGQTVVNIIPDTINYPNHLANALISPFTDFQFGDLVPRLEATTPDMQEGQIAGTGGLIVAGVGSAIGAMEVGGAAAEVSTASKDSEVVPALN
jgi:RHS repeat-associated protein